MTAVWMIIGTSALLILMGVAMLAGRWWLINHPEDTSKK